MNPGSRKRSLPLLCLIALLFPLCLGLRAQSPFERDFEADFFARREVWVDQLFQKASPARRKKAAPLILSSMAKNGIQSLASDRAQELAKAAAILQGLGSEDQRFLERFNLFLLALPEVVDPQKMGIDVQRIRAISKRMYPLLRRRTPVVDPDSPAKNREKIYLTAKGVFSWNKPKGLNLHFTIQGSKKGGRRAVLLEKERGDSNDSEGWLHNDLVVSFDVSGLPAGSYLGSSFLLGGDLREGIEWPSAKARFWVAPGFHQRAWKFFDDSKALLQRRGPSRPRALDLARLKVLDAEVFRALFGDAYRFRSWPVTALREGELLCKALQGGKIESGRPKDAPDGDRVFGVPLSSGAVVPVRVLWRKWTPQSKAYVFFPPEGWDENFLTDGLGLPIERVLPESGGVAVFLHFPAGKGYLPAVQELLRDCFQVTPKRTSVVGVLGGCVRARFGAYLMQGPLDRMILVGRDLPDPVQLVEKKVSRFLILPCFGQPPLREEAGMKLQFRKVLGSFDPKLVVMDRDDQTLRSLSEALQRIQAAK